MTLWPCHQSLGSLPDDDTVGVAPSLILAHVRHLGPVAADKSPKFGWGTCAPIPLLINIVRTFPASPLQQQGPLSLLYCTLYTVLKIQSQI